MGQGSSRHRLVARSLWLAAGAGTWLLVVNRVIMHWPNEILKTAAMGALAALVFAVTWVIGGRIRRLTWTDAAFVLICGYGLGELHRVWLRYTYRENVDRAAGAIDVDWLHPLTTTDLTRKHHAVSVKQPFARLRVVHLTDLHLTDALPWAFYRSIVERSNAERPDLVLLTGDLLTQKKYLPLLQRWLALGLEARVGVYAVLGNHEFWAGAAPEVRRLLDEASVHVLSGACERLGAERLERVIVCGTESPWGSDFGATTATTEELVLALSHTPDNIYALRGRAHAVFSGHLHGGQWRIPGIGSLIVPSVYGRRFDRGQFVVEGVHLFVSAGLGADKPPLRLYCPPELLVVDFLGENIEAETIARDMAVRDVQGRIN